MIELVENEAEISRVRKQDVRRKVRWLWLTQRHVPTKAPLTKHLDSRELSRTPAELRIAIGVLALREDRLVRSQALALQVSRCWLAAAFVEHVQRGMSVLKAVIELHVRRVRIVLFSVLESFVDDFRPRGGRHEA